MNGWVESRVHVHPAASLMSGLIWQGCPMPTSNCLLLNLIGSTFAIRKGATSGDRWNGSEPCSLHACMHGHGQSMHDDDSQTLGPMISSSTSVEMTL